MKNLVVFCDGTWNTPEQEDNGVPSPTNVVKMKNALATVTKDGVAQEFYYHPGVGTEYGWFKNLLGGLNGDGLSRNIMSAYAWLAKRYEPGDRIWLFGFSRGAFTVRSLGGFLSCCGLLDLNGLSDSAAFRRVEWLYREGYRNRRTDWNEFPRWPMRASAAMPIHFIGVWDTVGSLGIPDHMGLFNLLDSRDNWSFHQTGLGANVSFARHAIAMDERRANFTPTLWTDPETGAPLPNSERVKQLWFAGVHTDVGGGYLDSGLSDIALKWMIDEAELGGKGLAFVPDIVAQINPNPRGARHNSVRGMFKKLRTRPRNMPLVVDPQLTHDSVRERHAHPSILQVPYHGARRLALGESCGFPVYARDHWNYTGLYLEAGGRYEFSATGEWLDGSIECTPDGACPSSFNPGVLIWALAWPFELAERIYRKVMKNPRADFWMTRRLGEYPWFSLIGVIANDGGRGVLGTDIDGSDAPHQTFKIGSGPMTVTVDAPGYFFAFANDAWKAYGNNKGSVAVTVRRL